jgi:hypothetical protein
MYARVTTVGSAPDRIDDATPLLASSRSRFYRSSRRWTASRSPSPSVVEEAVSYSVWLSGRAKKSCGTPRKRRISDTVFRVLVADSQLASQTVS